MLERAVVQAPDGLPAALDVVHADLRRQQPRALRLVVAACAAWRAQLQRSPAAPQHVAAPDGNHDSDQLPGGQRRVRVKPLGACIPGRCRAWLQRLWVTRVQTMQPGPGVPGGSWLAKPQRSGRAGHRTARSAPKRAQLSGGPPGGRPSPRSRLRSAPGREGTVLRADVLGQHAGAHR